MAAMPSALGFLVMIFAGWVNRQQLIAIEYLQAQNRMLRERLRWRRLRFTDAERALLARKAKALGREVRLELRTLVTPDTLQRWHRDLVAAKWTVTHRRGAGRPAIMKDISALMVRMAVDNPTWGYTRIQGALANVGHRVGRGTVANVLKREAVELAPGTRQAHFVVDVPQGTLESLRRERFPERRSVDAEGIGDALHSVRDQLGRSDRAYRRYHDEPD